MPHPYFDAGDFDFRAEGGVLYETLCTHVFHTAKIRALFGIAWESREDHFPNDGSGTARDIWSEVLKVTTTARRLSRLCDAILADQNLVVTHVAVRAVVEAPDPLTVMAESSELPGEKLFLDRQPLRSSLSALSPDKSVLVVRGDRGSGKSATSELIRTFFSPRDEIVEVNADLNYTLPVLISRLELKLGRKPELKEIFTTESASHTEIVIGLLTLAENSPRWGEHRRLWIVVDDLNDVDEADPERPRLSHCGPIRSFMEAFVTQMRSKTDFGRYFRIVLIDYPARDLRWPDVWVPDTPIVGDITVEVIADALVKWMKRRSKTLFPAEARKRAENIIAAADAVPFSQRLKAINDAFLAQARSLLG